MSVYNDIPLLVQNIGWWNPGYHRRVIPTGQSHSNHSFSARYNILRISKPRTSSMLKITLFLGSSQSSFKSRVLPGLQGKKLRSSRRSVRLNVQKIVHISTVRLHANVFFRTKQINIGRQFIVQSQHLSHHPTFLLFGIKENWVRF